MKNIFFFTILLSSAAFAQAMPVEIISNSHTPLTARVQSQDGDLRVSGTVNSMLPGLRQAGSYVKVDLLGAGNQVLASATDKVGASARHPRSSSYGREFYTVTFPSGKSTGSVLVRVKFHNHSRAACPGTC